jgi:hypothetical protein
MYVEGEGNLDFCITHLLHFMFTAKKKNERYYVDLQYLAYK